MTAPPNLLVLDATVRLLGAADIGDDVRESLGIGADEFAIEGPGERSLARIVSGTTAALLQRFATPTTVDTAIFDISTALDADPFAMLDASVPVLDELIAAGILRTGSDPTRTTTDRPEVGQHVAGYRLDREIRNLQDTQVFQASTCDGRTVALKVVPSATGPADPAHLRHEVALQRLASGRGVPAVLGQGVHADLDYLVSEWCAGVPVSFRADELRSSGDTAGLLRLCRRVVRSFARLHVLGVVHGDVRFSNILVDLHDEVSVIDFGLSFRIGDRPLRRSTEFGTLEPEAARAMCASRSAPGPTIASEQYAIGALVWALLSGADLHPPCPVASEMCDRIASGVAPSFAACGRPRWPELEAIIARATAAAPSRRFRTLDEFAAALDQVQIPDRRPDRARTKKSVELVDRTIEQLAIGQDAAGSASNVHAGSAGAAWFLYRASQIRGEPDLLGAAEAQLGRPDELGPGSMLHGPCGAHAVAALVASARGDPSSAHHHALALLDSSSAHAAIELFDGRAGDLCGLAAVRQVFSPHRIPAPLSAAIESARSSMLPLLRGPGPGSTNSNIVHLGTAHGWAGILLALLVSGDSSVNGNLGRAVEELAASRVPIGRGVAWLGTVAGDQARRTPDYAPGWCAGSAGMINVIAEAADRGVIDVDGVIEAAAWHCADHPDRTPNLCCGLAGRVIALCRAWRATGDENWLDRADSLLDDAATRSAERPSGGLFRGHLGVALAALEFERPDSATMPLVGPQPRPTADIGDTPPHGERCNDSEPNRTATWRGSRAVHR